MSAQTYTDPTALSRMDYGLCPECGFPPDRHSGWGGPRSCSLTDGGVADRVAQHHRNLDEAGCAHEGDELNEDEHLAGCLHDGAAAKRLAHAEARWDMTGTSGYEL